MNKITVFAEMKENILDNVTFELISKAKNLTSEIKNLNGENYLVETVLVNNSIEEKEVEKAFDCGCNSFILVKQNAQSFIEIANCFIQYYLKNPSKMILFPATNLGRIVAPRITTKLDTGLVADCTGLDIILKDNCIKLASTRPTFGSELMATILSKKDPQCATIRPKVFVADFNNRQNNPKYIEYNLESFIENKINIIETQSKENNLNIKQELEDAKIILTAGFGLYDGTNNYYKKLKDFAKKIGASYAVTRKVVDFGLEKPDYQIGQTGLTVCPKLYIAFGVSGAIQHIMGMKNSKKIVAINNDPNSEIFKYSDYKIVKDAKEIIDSFS